MTKNSAAKRAARAYMAEHPGTNFHEALRIVTAQHQGRKKYRVEVYRDGDWIMIAIPELDGLTQTKNPEDVADTARDYIAVTTDTPIEEVRIDVQARTAE